MSLRVGQFVPVGLMCHFVSVSLCRSVCASRTNVSLHVGQFVPVGLMCHFMLVSLCQ